MEKPEDVLCPTIRGSLSTGSIGVCLLRPPTRPTSECRTRILASNHQRRHQLILPLFLLICHCDGKPEGMATDTIRAEIVSVSVPESEGPLFMRGGEATAVPDGSQETCLRANH